MFGVNFTYSIQTAASDVDIENARHRTESDSDDGCPAESPEMVFSQAEMLNEADGDNTLGNKDIHKIISQCLKDAKKLQSGCTVKILTQLTAASEYVKLQALYFTYGKCKKPHINASLAIAQCMGKGPYFTQQICNNEKCFVHHHHLPLPKARKSGGPESLLENEDVLHAVQVYLATQKLGSITPLLLCKHINSVIKAVHCLLY